MTRTNLLKTEWKDNIILIDECSKTPEKYYINGNKVDTSTYLGENDDSYKCECDDYYIPIKLKSDFIMKTAREHLVPLGRG